MRHKQKSRAKNVLMKDGSARRLPEDVCEQMLDSGQARHYISNTVYRALSLGIDVADAKTRDEKGTLRDKIFAAREKVAKRRKKDEDRFEREERELLDDDAA